MNPAKRKKLYRLELQKKETQVTNPIDVKVEEKVLEKEELKTKTVESAINTDTIVAATVTPEIGLKLQDTELLDNKKDKKKKTSSQES